MLRAISSSTLLPLDWSPFVHCHVSCKCSRPSLSNSGRVARFEQDYLCQFGDTAAMLSPLPAHYFLGLIGSGFLACAIGPFRWWGFGAEALRDANAKIAEGAPNSAVP